jgi:hypothetical protein
VLLILGHYEGLVEKDLFVLSPEDPVREPVLVYVGGIPLEAFKFS